MSTTPPKPTKQERRDAARQERLDAELAEQAAATRRKRLTALLGIAGLVAVVLVVIVVATGGGGDDAGSRSAATADGGAVSGQAASATLLKDIPQDGIALGDPDAPVRLVEFADLQCPVCRDYSMQTLPTLIRDYVRTGKVRMELHTLAFLGDDSVTAAHAAAGAAQQDKLWNFADLFYANQGEENSGYVTPDFLERIYGAAGVTAAEADAFAATEAAGKPITEAEALANRYAVTGTPTVLVGRKGGGLAKLELAPDDVGGFKSAIDGLLK